MGTKWYQGNGWAVIRQGVHVVGILHRDDVEEVAFCTPGRAR